MGNYTTRPKNAIFLSPSNSEEHEMEKCRQCYEILKKGMKFITEAVDNHTKERADIVVLDTGERIEIETDKNRAKRFEGTDITVIKMWEKTAR
jgi:cellulose biosynthesis protein BcsQ